MGLIDTYLLAGRLEAESRPEYQEKMKQLKEAEKEIKERMNETRLEAEEAFKKAYDEERKKLSEITPEQQARFRRSVSARSRIQEAILDSISLISLEDLETIVEQYKDNNLELLEAILIKLRENKTDGQGVEQ